MRYECGRREIPLIISIEYRIEVLTGEVCLAPFLASTTGSQELYGVLHLQTTVQTSDCKLALVNIQTMYVTLLKLTSVKSTSHAMPDEMGGVVVQVRWCGVIELPVQTALL